MTQYAARQIRIQSYYDHRAQALNWASAGKRISKLPLLSRVGGLAGQPEARVAVSGWWLSLLFSPVPFTRPLVYLEM
jgi:hypothetical protein